MLKHLNRNVFKLFCNNSLLHSSNHKKIMIRLYTFLLLIFSLTSFAQNKSVVSGSISNKETNEPLPFASITLKNHLIGTISNENGEFDFYIPESKRNDTIVISFIGFNPYEIPLASTQGEIKINLQPSNEVLAEVIVSPLSPLDYIKRALKYFDQNYPQDSYQSLAYYREKFIENGAVINKEEAVFKTFYSEGIDSTKNQHQLLLYKPEENPQQFQFMREWFEKKQAKRKKKAIKKGEDYDEDEFSTDMDMNLGGPESVIELDLQHDKDNFLKEKYFKKYEYTFGKETIFNGDTLVTIIFKGKKNIDYVKDHGKILISKDNYAIVRIEQNAKFSIPFMVKPILFTLGLKINKPQFKRVISYQKYQDLWYPQLFRWDANVKLTKRHTFSSNEYSDIKIGQVFFINKLDSVATSIPKGKRFDSDEDMEYQVHNDDNISWEGMNVIKD